MPVPQRVNFIVEGARCLFRNGQDARSTKSEFYCGTGILPVLENDARAVFMRSFFLCTSSIFIT
ncbi:hypothetical protein QUB70_00520 [Microcoleus sp. A003_D6]